MKKTIIGRQRRLSLASVPLATAAFMQVAVAADEAPVAKVEEIVVTAQKRAERLQDVPVSVTAVSGETMEKLGISRWDDMPLPGVKVGIGGATDSMFIRGIGSGSNAAFEQSAPVFIDGMWISSSRAARIGFLDMERLEVLKGPQPTYFGKNAIAGAMSIVSRKPRFKQEGYVDAEYEFENQETILSAAASVPLNETLALRVAGRGRQLDKGWDQNLATGAMDPRYKDNAGRISARWIPNDNFTLDAKIESGKTSEVGRSTELTACTPAAAANPGIVVPGVANCTLDFKRAVTLNPADFGIAATMSNVNRPPEAVSNKLDTAQISATWTMNGYNLAANLSSYKLAYTADQKQDHSAADRGLTGGIENNDNKSLELRLDSPRNQKFFWTVGLYSDRGSSDLYQYQILMEPAANGGPTGVALGPLGQRSTLTLASAKQTASSSSGFGEVGFALTDEMVAKVAVRSTTQKKSLDGYQKVYFLSGGTQPKVSPSGLGGLLPGSAPTVATLAPAPNTFAGSQSIENKSTDPAVTFEWKPIPRQMIYASARRGFKAGGLDILSLPFGTMEFKPEKVNYGELGAKLDLMDGAMRFNAALFQADYKDLQTAIVDPLTGSTATRNAGGARARGLELDGAWALSEQWRLGASINFLDSAYTDFKGQNCWANPQQTAAQGCLPVGATGTSAQDMSGKDTQFAPKVSGSAQLSYRRPGEYLGMQGVFGVLVSVTSSSSYQTFNNGDPNTRAGSYNLVDLRIDLAESKNKWDVAFLVRNLLDTMTVGWIANAPSTGAVNGAHFAVVNRPRQIALQGRYNF